MKTRLKLQYHKKMHVYFHEFKKCNTDIYVCNDAVLLSSGDFLIRNEGLKISSMISTQNVKLILGGFEKSLSKVR